MRRFDPIDFLLDLTGAALLIVAMLCCVVIGLACVVLGVHLWDAIF